MMCGGDIPERMAHIHTVIRYAAPEWKHARHPVTKCCADAKHQAPTQRPRWQARLDNTACPSVSFSDPFHVKSLLHCGKKFFPNPAFLQSQPLRLLPVLSSCYVFLPHSDARSSISPMYDCAVLNPQPKSLRTSDFDR
jgi:hypothetical protein